MRGDGGGDKALPHMRGGDSNGGQEMTKMSAADKKWWQQRQTRYCKDGCHRQETMMRMCGGSGDRGRDGRVAMIVVSAADDGGGRQH
jgi:hypothetical protein